MWDFSECVIVIVIVIIPFLVSLLSLLSFLSSLSPPLLLSSLVPPTPPPPARLHLRIWVPLRGHLRYEPTTRKRLMGCGPLLASLYPLLSSVLTCHLLPSHYSPLHAFSGLLSLFSLSPHSPNSSCHHEGMRLCSRSKRLLLTDAVWVENKEGRTRAR